MPGSSISLEGLEAFMAHRKRAIAFPPAIEQQFESDTAPRRCQRLRTGILVSVVIYNTFLVADWLLVPDVLWRAALLHFGMVTPWMLFAAWAISKGPSRRIREGLAASIPLLIMLQIDYGFATTSSPHADHYQYVVIPTLLYANVSLHRLTFRHACVVTAAIVVGHSLLLFSVAHVPTVAAVIILAQLLACAYITLVANYQMERDLRRAYLFSLRDRLRHAEADATSRRDALTGLANRRQLDATLAQLWEAPSAHSAVSVVLVDVDHFKALNDRYGHSAGDLCLKRVAAILTTEMRGGGDLAVRFGGEEFLLLLPGTDLPGAMRIAERVRRAVEAAAIPNEDGGFRGVVTASFGVASSSTADLSAIELIAAADSALYAAKRKGRNQVWPPLAGVHLREEPAAVVPLKPPGQRAG
jgi:diguanylate cyclase (GGDEF)-like protein